MHRPRNTATVILGMTALMQYALQACSEEDDVDELVGVAKEIAKHTLEHGTRRKGRSLTALPLFFLRPYYKAPVKLFTVFEPFKYLCNPRTTF